MKGHGTIFLAGPPLVKAATGEVVTAEDLGGADVHTRVSGVADHFARDDREALRIARSIVETIGRAPAPGFDVATPEDPKYDPDELLGILPTDVRTPYDAPRGDRPPRGRQPLPRVQGPLRHDARHRLRAPPRDPRRDRREQRRALLREPQKGAHFVELCCQRGVPLLFLQNVTGFMVGRAAEAGGIARDGAKLVQAVATANVPKITVIIGASFGAGNYGMCGRGYDARFLFTWPNARICVMGGEQAAQVMLTVKREQLAYEGKPRSRPRRRTRSSRPIRAEVRARGAPVLRVRAPVGRRRRSSRRGRATCSGSRSRRRSRRPMRPPRRPSSGCDASPWGATTSDRPAARARSSATGAVARVALDRPERRNAFDDGSRSGCARRSTPSAPTRRSAWSCSRGAATSSARAATSAGCSARAAADGAELRGRAARSPRRSRRSTAAPRPSWRSVRGAALGGGAGLVAAVDIAVAAESTTFGFPEVKLGIVPAAISPYVVSRRSAGPRAEAGSSRASASTPRRRCASGSCRRSWPTPTSTPPSRGSSRRS